MTNPLIARSLVAAALTVCLGACNDPSEKNRQAEEARVSAEAKARAATEEAEKKAANLQAMSDTEAARIREKGAEKANEAKAEAQGAAVDAQASLQKAKVAAKEKSLGKLASLEKDLADVRAKVDKKLPKPEAAKVTQELTTKTADVRKRIGDLDNTTSTELEAAKDAVKNSLDALEAAIDNAKTRV